MASTPAGTTGASCCRSSFSSLWFCVETRLPRGGLARLTSKRQSPPMSPLLSKQVGASPSSRQHFRAHRPEAPAPMMATLWAAMSRVWWPRVVASGTLGKPRQGVKHAQGRAEPGGSHQRNAQQRCSVGDGLPCALGG